jgi:hypothetical protein
MTDRELLKLALETLIAPQDAKYGRKFNDTVKTLKDALKPTDELHTCSYECDRPECVRAQRDELRDRVERLDGAAHWALEALIKADRISGYSNHKSQITALKMALGRQE